MVELINNKLLNDKEIIITRAELESLRIFLSLLSFRSDLRMNQYKNNPLFSEENAYPYKVENKNPPSILKHFTKDPFFLFK